MVVLAAAALGGMAFHLARLQERSQSTTESDFAHRAKLAAKLVSAALGATLAQPPELGGELGGGPKRIGSALAVLRQRSQTPAVGLFDADGKSLGGSPSGVAGTIAGQLGASEISDAARHGLALSNIIYWGPTRTPMLALLVAARTDSGVRVLAEMTPAAALATASAFIAEAPAEHGATAYLLDGAGRVLGASDGAKIGSALRDPMLSAAVRRQHTGDVGNHYFVDAPISSGSGWQVVFWVPTATLLARDKSASATDWLLFAALITALLGFLAVTWLAGRRSAELVRSEERAFAAQQLAQARLRDPITGLPTREMFLETVDCALGRSGDLDGGVAVLFVDLDGFKRVNDSLGHEAGDELLRAFARRLRDVIGPLDMVSRFGGDEFLVLCETLPKPELAIRLAKRIRVALEVPFDLRSRPVELTCSIGIATQSADDGPTDSSSMVRKADAAMYDVKTRGGGGIRVFDRELNEAAMRRLDTELALRAALDRGELSPYYQPIVQLDDGRIRGVEALARWERPGVGLVMPGDFIEAAEGKGLINELGAQILTRAMADVAGWHSAGLLEPDFQLAVNVSPRQLTDPSFYETVQSLLDSWALPPSSLCLEITESAVVHDPDAALEALTRLSELGAKVAIDDFGVGQSSLSQVVRTLPVDVLKLDRAFASELSQPRDRAVVTAVVVMANMLRVDAIAEGVETEEQASTLLEVGYKLAQGFLFGHPIAEAKFRQRLATEQQLPAGPRLTLTA
jgi:diguanylate cyclase (GGDEF)-like protein